MAEKLAYWLVDAVADGCMSAAFNQYKLIMVKTLKLTSGFLRGAKNLLHGLNTIGGVARAGFQTSAGQNMCAMPWW